MGKVFKTSVVKSISSILDCIDTLKVKEVLHMLVSSIFVLHFLLPAVGYRAIF